MILFLLVAYLVWMVLYLFVVAGVVLYFVATLLFYWFACGGAYLVARVRGTAVPVKEGQPALNIPGYKLSEHTKTTVAIWTAVGSAIFVVWWVANTYSTYS